MKCLAKESDRRYASAAELADDLRAIRDDRPIQARPTSVFEQLSRWARKHQGLVRTAGVAAMATVLIGLLVSFGVETWHEQNRTAFRLRAAGGPYSTTIQPANGRSNSTDEAMSLTVPMQSYAKLPHGDYDLMLSSRGRWSQKVRLPIRPGIDTEYSMHSQSPPLREISIDKAFAMPTAGFDGPAVVWSRDGVLKRYAIDEKDDWSMHASEIETKVISIPALNGKTVPKAVTNSESEAASDKLIVDFSIAPKVGEANWLRAGFHKNPQIATPRRTLASAIDLDTDGRADTVVAAMKKSALLAVGRGWQSSMGKVLRLEWSLA